MVVPEVSQFWKSFNMLRSDFGAIESKMQCLLYFLWGATLAK